MLCPASPRIQCPDRRPRSGLQASGSASFTSAPPPGSPPAPPSWRLRLPALLFGPSLQSVFQASRHGRWRVGRGSPGSRAASLVTVVATAAATAASWLGNSRGGGRDPAVAILTTNGRRVLRDGNQGGGQGGEVRPRQPIRGPGGPSSRN